MNEGAARAAEAPPSAPAPDAGSAPVATLLLPASPFAKLAPSSLRRLAERLVPLTVEAGQGIVRQGEVGDCCYVIQSGRVEVVAALGGDERRLSTLGPGALFGEATVLTSPSRAATVRALEPCTLFSLARSDLLAAIREDPAVVDLLREMLALRDRPQAAPGVVVHERPNAGGEPVRVLRDPSRGAYFQLSAVGWFLWQRLDGKRTIRDLILEHFREQKSFAPHLVAEAIARLQLAGFASQPALRPDVAPFFAPRVGQGRILSVLARAAGARVVFAHVDDAFARLHRVLRPLFTRAGRVALLALLLLGLLAFARAAPAAIAALGTASPAALLWPLLPGYLVNAVVHELAHGLTLKAHGRQVLGVGLGLQHFLPVFFVDTTDGWLAPRAARVWVGLAGPYASALVAAAAALCALVVGPAALSGALWEVALVGFGIAAFNLTPLLELDGCHILSDLLERPQLRMQSLAWLRRDLPRALRAGTLRGSLAANRACAWYAAGVLVHTAAMVSLALVGYRMIV